METIREFKTMIATEPSGVTTPMLVVGVDDLEGGSGPESWTHYGFVPVPDWRTGRRPSAGPNPDVVLDVSGAPTFLLGDRQILQLDGDSLHVGWLPMIRSSGECLVGFNLNSNPHLAWATVKRSQI